MRVKQISIRKRDSPLTLPVIVLYCPSPFDVDINAAHWHKGRMGATVRMKAVMHARTGSRQGTQEEGRDRTGQLLYCTAM